MEAKVVGTTKGSNHRYISINNVFIDRTKKKRCFVNEREASGRGWLSISFTIIINIASDKLSGEREGCGSVELLSRRILNRFGERKERKKEKIRIRKRKRKRDE